MAMPPIFLRSLRGTQAKAVLPAKLVSLYSAPVSVELRLGDDGHFKVWRAVEGPQVIINWKVPDGAIVEVRLIRKYLSWPESIDDGTLLVTDDKPWNVNHYSDRDIDDYEVYYYAMFFKRTDGLWFFDRRFRGKTFPLPTGYCKGKLWELLPNVYHREDNGEERDERQITRVTTGP